MTVDRLCELAMAHFNAGRAFEAEQDCRRAIAIDPEHLGALHLLALVLQHQHQLEDAERLLRRCVELEPGEVKHRNNWGVVLGQLGRFDESAEVLQEAVALAPHYAPGYRNLGIAMVRKGILKEAIASLRRSIELTPDDAASHTNLGRALLFTGDFANGLPEMEWRFCKQRPWWMNLPVPLWENDTPLAGRSILLHAEQGLGDTLQFCRYARTLREVGAAVFLMAQPALCSLLNSLAAVEKVLPLGQPLSDRIDLHAPLMSLPFLLKTRLETIPRQVPYLHVDAVRIRYWGEKLQQFDAKFKIGIAWQGSATYFSDAIRSIPLTQFEPLARLSGVQLFSLQKGHGSEQLKAFACSATIVQLDLDPGNDAFLDTAAMMNALDLVITSDTAIAHLAGALGVPVWVALSAAPDWRWLADRNDSPWYPTMRVFRQKTLGDWSMVVDEMADCLQKSLQPSNSSAASCSSSNVSVASPTSVTIQIGPGELLDRLGILRLKVNRLEDGTKRMRLSKELAVLEKIAQAAIPPSDLVDTLAAALAAVNDCLWQAEDELRDREAAGDLGIAYVKLARSICRLNDRRSALKGKIDQTLGSAFVESKIYGNLKQTLSPKVS